MLGPSWPDSCRRAAGQGLAAASWRRDQPGVAEQLGDSSLQVESFDPGAPHSARWFSHTDMQTMASPDKLATFLRSASRASSHIQREGRAARGMR
mmetsp:Transcript_107464/g.190377  ORF Transcript_107464/g.190377 Transcript_107464/m.190377 type:complete len:95 (-) Transcript_107464:2376-2660(-)